MSYQNRVEEVAARLTALASAGQVHARLRIVSSWDRYLAAFKDANGVVNGWEITRGSADSPDGHHFDEVYLLRKFYGINDEAESDFAFQESLDEAVREFRDHPDLTFGSVPIGLRLETIDARLFGNVLCHFAEGQLPVKFGYSQL